MRARGFTLVEVMIVLAIAGLLAAIVLAGLQQHIDPWGRPYQYLNIRVSGTSNARKDKKLKPLNSDFDLYSMGPDGLTNKSLNNAKSRDDVVRARDGGFIGTAEEFDP